MKKFYSSPEFEVSLISVADVIMISGDEIIDDGFGRDDTSVGGGDF